MNRTKHVTNLWQSLRTEYLLESLDGISVWLPDLSLLYDLPLVDLGHLISSTTCISCLTPHSCHIKHHIYFTSDTTFCSCHIKHCTYFTSDTTFILYQAPHVHVILSTTCISLMTPHSSHIKHNMYFTSDTTFCSSHIKHNMYFTSDTKFILCQAPYAIHF